MRLRGEDMGVIYILTNPSFEQYVKIGYADDMEARLKKLNQSECIPFAFRVYATYEVSNRLTDLKLHRLIDQLNPTLRAVENFEGRERKREFYAMSPEEAYGILEAIAEINGCEEKLRLIAMSEADKVAAETAEEIRIESKERTASFTFTMCNIPVGAQLQFWLTVSQPTDEVCYVVDEKRVDYKGEIYSLSALARKLSGKNYCVHGPCYFKYNGEWLNDIRDRFERKI